MESLKILVIEDELIAVEAINKCLSEQGYHILKACQSAQKAIAFSKVTQPDVILADIYLGKGAASGIEAVESIFSYYQVPVVYLTALADEQTYQRAKNTYPAAYLSKPYKCKDLVRAIDLAITQFQPSFEQVSPVKRHKSIPSILDTHIFLYQNKGYHKLSLSDIQWLEADGSYCKIYTTNSPTPLTQSCNLKTFLSNIPNELFIRISSKHAVNLSHVERVAERSVHLGEKMLPIGKRYYQDMMESLPHIKRNK